MKRLLLVVIVVACWSSCAAWTAGEAEAGSASRGRYLAERGKIVTPEEVHIDSYVAGVDYRYPKPTSSLLGVSLYSGNRQLSASGQEEVIQIGIQGRKGAYEDLIPMNLSFVIDHSGSMAAADKLDWVKDAFDIFIQRVRDIDYVSLVVFDDEARVVFPATRMSSEQKRKEFTRAVRSIRPEGSTNIRDGLLLGCLEVVKNLNQEYTNRVLFLSDGQDTCGNTSQSILEVVKQFSMHGVTISTIGVGTSFDLELMVEMAKIGSGSSRFISDREEMERTFGSELDRMVVPLAKNLEMALEFLVDVEVLDTWGYRNQRRGSIVYYSQPTFHHGDYETIMVHLRVLPQAVTGEADIARFAVRYEDVYGNTHQSGPHVLRATFVDGPSPVVGFSDGMVLRSGTMLRFAQNLKTIGELYYVHKNHGNVERALELSVGTKKELLNARLRLDNQGFDTELRMMDQYIGILGGELQLAEEEIARIVGDVEMAPAVPERSLGSHLGSLCAEIALDLQTKAGSRVALCAFAGNGDAVGQVTNLVSSMVSAEIARKGAVVLVEDRDLAAAFHSRGFSPSDMTDTLNAVAVGNAVAADYVVTGVVIETENTYVIFSRLLNVGNREVESAAQAIVAKS